MSSPERDFVHAHLDDLHADLDAWLRIPSISADPAHAADVAAQRRLAGRGAAPHRLPDRRDLADRRARRPSSPSGRPRDAGAPVALVYGHHDVQPVDPPELWVHPPFEPTRVDGPDGPELHARGAIDDKGNVAFHLLGMRAHLAATGRDTPAVTVKLLIEGEEESGSPHFAALLQERRDRLACDVVVVSDTGMAAPDVPSAVTAMRGLADAEITLRGPAVDLHSGSFGGAVPNPLHAMASLLAALHDDQGRVTLPGFYDKVRPLGDRERELMGRVPFDEQAWLAGPAASRVATGEEGFTHPGADRRPPDRRGQRHVGRLHRPRPQDDHPGRGARQGHLPAGRRPAPRGRRRSGARLGRGEPPRRHRGRGARPARRRRAVRQRPRLPVRWTPCCARSPRPSTPSPTTSCSPARAAAAPRPTWSRSSAPRCSSSAPGCPPTASTRRTSGCCCRCSTAARRRRRTCGASWLRCRAR